MDSDWENTKSILTTMMDVYQNDSELALLLKQRASEVTALHTRLSNDIRDSIRGNCRALDVRPRRPPLHTVAAAQTGQACPIKSKWDHWSWFCMARVSRCRRPGAAGVGR